MAERASDRRPLAERVEEIVRREMASSGTPGVAVALTDREQVRAAGASGFADLAARTPVAAETLFEIGSIGKTFTATVLLRLREAGRVDLEAPVTRYLPWFEVGGTTAPITLHHLLTHTAGIVAGIDGTPSAASEVWALRRTTVGGPPGERFHYSNVGYKTLGLVIEAITGAPYGETIRELLRLVGMGDAEPTIRHEMRSRLAVGYAPLYDDRPPLKRHPLVPATWLETDTADGSIAASATDLAAFLRMLLNRGNGPHGPVLSAESFALLTTPAIPDEGDGYGYGIQVKQADGQTEIGHPGGMVGYHASMLGEMETGLGVVVLCNGPGAPVALSRQLLALLRAEDAAQTPPPPANTDAATVEKTPGYVGAYVGAGTADPKRFSIAAVPGDLRFRRGAADLPVEQHWDDDFVIDDPDLARFVLRFERDEEGRVLGAIHGADRYAKEGEAAPPAVAELPDEWCAYLGRYRSHNPWVPTFVVLDRGGQLRLLFPAGEPDGLEDDQPLIPLADGSFRCGDDPASPERINFDAFVDGLALRATLSGADFWRCSID